MQYNAKNDLHCTGVTLRVIIILHLVSEITANTFRIGNITSAVWKWILHCSYSSKVNIRLAHGLQKFSCSFNHPQFNHRLKSASLLLAHTSSYWVIFCYLPLSFIILKFTCCLCLQFYFLFPNCLMRDVFHFYVVVSLALGISHRVPPHGHGVQTVLVSESQLGHCLLSCFLPVVFCVLLSFINDCPALSGFLFFKLHFTWSIYYIYWHHLFTFVYNFK